MSVCLLSGLPFFEAGFGKADLKALFWFSSDDGAKGFGSLHGHWVQAALVKIMGPEPSGLLGCLKLEFQLRVSGCIRVELGAYRHYWVLSRGLQGPLSKPGISRRTLWASSPKAVSFWVNGVWGLG